MKNELQINTEHNIWHDESSLNEIREIFAPTLLANEFKAFVGMGKATGLNPFLREIWAVKYDKTKPAQIFIGRDGYRKSAQRHPDYDYHQVDAVYSGDVFTFKNGVVEHEYKLANRGALIGAYCIVQRRNSSRPFYVFVELREYDLNQSVWKDKKATMIKKVAEAQALKGAFQEQFGNSYSEHEEYEANRPPAFSQTEKTKDVLNKKQDVEVVDITPTTEPEKPPAFNSGRDDLPIQDDQIDFIYGMIKEKEMPDERLTKALAYFKVDCVESMTDAQARLFILQLQKL